MEPRTIHPFPRCPKTARESRLDIASAQPVSGGELDQQLVTVITFENAVQFYIGFSTSRKPSPMGASAVLLHKFIFHREDSGPQNGILSCRKSFFIALYAISMSGHDISNCPQTGVCCTNSVAKSLWRHLREQTLSQPGELAQRSTLFMAHSSHYYVISTAALGELLLQP